MLASYQNLRFVDLVLGVGMKLERLGSIYGFKNIKNMIYVYVPIRTRKICKIRVRERMMMIVIITH